MSECFKSTAEMAHTSNKTGGPSKDHQSFKAVSAVDFQNGYSSRSQNSSDEHISGVITFHETHKITGGRSITRFLVKKFNQLVGI
ncbi:MAG TPA: hypothetical protein VJH96_01845 [Patescibacteria group bacterium]|nr:hypothetical protein [Patescibacteria group bacterium]